MKNIGLIARSILFASLIASTVITVGCSSHRTTTETTTEVRRDPERSNDGTWDDQTRASVEVSKTKETTKEEEGHHGFFGILGDIIALPFRAIGAIL